MDGRRWERGREESFYFRVLSILSVEESFRAKNTFKQGRDGLRRVVADKNMGSNSCDLNQIVSRPYPEPRYV